MFVRFGPLPDLPRDGVGVDTLPALIARVGAGDMGLVVCAPADVGEVVQALRDNRLVAHVVAVGPPTPALGAKAIRQGAVEYLTDPVDVRVLDALLRKYAPAAPLGQVIAGDPRTHALLGEAAQYAASHATILLRGESGCGKEVMARYIHTHSPRADKPFVAVNCAAIPENLLESELFGHTKGAFSGAVADRKGKFALAHGGTLLLDEISEMDLALQAKLLRAIQEKMIDPLGADKPVPVDFRLVATTNRRLEEYVAAGKFREDLYFRLSVVVLELPPLRERVGDIAPLAAHFLRQHAHANGYAATPALAPDALSKLETCYWKGNVRELENTLHRALLLAGAAATHIEAGHIILSPMSLQHMPVSANNTNAQASVSPLASPYAAVAAAYSTGGASATFIPKRLADLERDALLSTLNYTQGNRQYAADLLGISVTVLSEKMAAVGLAS